MSAIGRASGGESLSALIADRAPLFYRRLPDLVRSLSDGLFMTAFKETVSRLPTSSAFRESHFGEIVSAVFAEDVLGLRLLYSKLSLLTAENDNAHKMDLVLSDPNEDPLALYFAEVKCSPKRQADGLPAGHEKSCYPALFDSLRDYTQRDLDFDIAAAKDHIDDLEDGERERVRAALLPYSESPLRYAGFVAIDATTWNTSEGALLATRRSEKAFDVDVLCIEDFEGTALEAYENLERLRDGCTL